MNTFTELKKFTDFEIDVFMKDVDLSIVNALRRVIISEIPNVGFKFDPNNFTEPKDINIIQNNTPLHNEFIQHRISLIPINVTIDELSVWNSDDYTFEINKTNNTGSLMNVYSSDINVIDSNNNIRNDLSKRFFPPDPISKDHILITKINPKSNSKLILRAKAIKAIPKTTTSFGMVSKCAVEFIVDDAKAGTEMEKYIQQNSFKMSRDDLKHQFMTIERERHYHRNKYREPNYFKMSLVSECNIPCVFILSQGINVLKSKIQSFRDTEHAIINNNQLYTIIVQNESHTLGNLFQSLCFNHFIRENEDESKFALKFIGYNQPHPLEESILIKLKGDNINTPDDVKVFIKDASIHILDKLTELENQWNTISNQ